MATYKPGPFGPFNGKIGTVVGSRWKSLNVARGVPSKSSKAPSQAQLDQRAKFGLVTHFLGRISNMISVGYQFTNGNVTPMNVAVKYHLSTVTGSYPDYKIDYPKVVISNGKEDVDNGWRTKVVAEEGGVLNVSWELNAFPTKFTLPTDTVYLLFYDEVQDRYLGVLSGATRSELNCDVYFPDTYYGGKVHCWMFFAAADQKAVSKSQYLGEISVME